jgi:hypothetical protein
VGDLVIAPWDNCFGTRHGTCPGHVPTMSHGTCPGHVPTMSGTRDVTGGTHPSGVCLSCPMSHWCCPAQKTEAPMRDPRKLPDEFRLPGAIIPTLGGQVYRLDRVEPHQRRDGTMTSIAIWTCSACADCGAPFRSLSRDNLRLSSGIEQSDGGREMHRMPRRTCWDRAGWRRALDAPFATAGK